MSPYLSDLIRYAESFLGVPYAYGSNHIFTGFDCSGYLCEVLRSVGLVGTKEDLTACDLYGKFSKEGTACLLHNPPTGSLLFYGGSKALITHVSLVVSPYSIIECGGGDSHTTRDVALKTGACVRKRSLNHRQDKVACLYPHYPWE